MKTPLLIILAGLPGVGKTTLAKTLAVYYMAVFLRIDSIEQSILNSSLMIEDVKDAGYEAGFLIAKDNLALGNSVVADSVNPVSFSRQSWRTCTNGNDCNIIEIELICSDVEEHKDRVEKRTADISGQQLPSWEDVLDREYDKWDSPHIIIDTAGNISNEVARIAIYEIDKFLKESL